MLSKSIIDYFKLFLVYLQVVVQSLIANITLFLISKKLGGFNDSIVTPRGQSINLLGIITPTVIYPIFGVLVFIFLVKFTSKSLKYFKIAGYGFLLIAFAGPLGLENALLSDKIILEIMHLIVGVQFIEFVSCSYGKIVLESNQTPKSDKVKKPQTVNL
ncbi:MAG: hypothetical protein H7196_00575 [candidate division SR1 bacterium]|nr:hypothetical protein [candidate division SR1 bacterium]